MVAERIDKVVDSGRGGIFPTFPNHSLTAVMMHAIASADIILSAVNTEDFVDKSGLPFVMYTLLLCGISWAS